MIQLGAPRTSWHDVYYGFLVLPWGTFFLSLAAIYLVLNLFYAVLFAIHPGSISGARPWSLLEPRGVSQVQIGLTRR